MSSKLRVLHVIPSVATGDGGPVEMLRRLVSSLADFAVVPSVIATDIRLAGSDLSTFNCQVDLATARPPGRLNFAPAIGRLIRSRLHDVDVVHVHSVDTYPTTVAVRLANAAGVPVVLQPHGAYDRYHRYQNRHVKSLYLNFVDRRYFYASKAVIASSDREASGIREVLGMASFVLPLGVDPRIFALKRNARAPGVVLFLGRLTEKKSPDRVIRSFALSGLAERGVRLKLAGPTDPRLPYDVAAVARSEGVSEHVDLLGTVDRERRSQLLAEADVFVLPSLDESFGVSVAEAMAAGCHVISSPEVGLAPTAAAAGALQVVPHEDLSWAAALEDEFNRLRRDDWAPKLEVREYARSNFDWPVVAERFAAIYRSVCGQQC